MENALIILVVLIVLFIVFRKFNLWYWKIQEHIDNQKQIISLLEKVSSRVGSMDEDITELSRIYKGKNQPEPKSGLLDD
ncbi:hypothetical protein [Enterobacter genomosp. S]|uniref:Uncharacterized protein n=1 Tax=Enterobacter genomosp. S TaxID=2364151 RepID=A0ABR5YLH9_9ENTR|nr:hypothetical protein [Enterobacter genomosp. S]KZR30371.1 hypothetical protein A3466_07680 [Enterobacter genomosp. S]